MNCPVEDIVNERYYTKQDHFTGISLAETDRIVPLHKRIDTKFVMTFKWLLAILKACRICFCIEKWRIRRYETRYYDRPECHFTIQIMLVA
jgi:hypothetical protein